MKAILSNPKHGWCNLNINDKNNSFSATPSYLTDVMYDALTAVMNYLTDGIAAVKFDCEEDGEVILVINTTECYIITDNPEKQLICFVISGKEICDNIIRCYETNKDEWINFATLEPNNDTEYNESKKKFDSAMQAIQIAKICDNK